MAIFWGLYKPRESQSREGWAVRLTLWAASLLLRRNGWAFGAKYPVHVARHGSSREGSMCVGHGRSFFGFAAFSRKQASECLRELVMCSVFQGRCTGHLGDP